MDRMILSDTIFTYEIVAFTILMAILIIRRKLKLKQYIFLVGLFGTFALYVKNVFKTIVIGESIWSTKGSYSMIPFGNLLSFVLKKGDLTDELATLILEFFVGIIPFFILSGFFISGIFTNRSKFSYKKLFIFGSLMLELLQVIAFTLVYNDRVYMGIFDISAFLLVPFLYGLGLFIYRILFEQREHKTNDKN